jgi:hypothetical protein
MRYRPSAGWSDAVGDVAHRKAPRMNEDPGAASPILGIVFTVIALAILLAA